jgi:hypothetical protein
MNDRHGAACADQQEAGREMTFHGEFLRRGTGKRVTDFVRMRSYIK